MKAIKFRGLPKTQHILLLRSRQQAAPYHSPSKVSASLQDIASLPHLPTFLARQPHGYCRLLGATTFPAIINMGVDTNSERFVDAS